jgi:hypothetical protein
MMLLKHIMEPSEALCQLALFRDRGLGMLGQMFLLYKRGIFGGDENLPLNMFPNLASFE